MSRYSQVPELLEQYMENSGSAACWVTVREIRAYFNLDDSAGPALSGFLQKIYQGPYYTCQYKVVRIEKFRDTVPPYRLIRRYLVQERPAVRRQAESAIRNVSDKPVNKLYYSRQNL